MIEELERLAFSRITNFSLNESGGVVVREAAPVDAVAAVSKARHYHRESTSRHGVLTTVARYPNLTKPDSFVAAHTASAARTAPAASPPSWRAR